MGDRISLQTILQAVIGVRPDGKPNVYFQPPETLKLNYPCIIYSRSRVSTKYADNKSYKSKIGYLVTAIDQNPDSILPDRIGQLPLSSFVRHYTADNLNHDVYNVYY